MRSTAVVWYAGITVPPQQQQALPNLFPFVRALEGLCLHACFLLVLFCTECLCVWVLVCVCVVFLALKYRMTLRVCVCVCDGGGGVCYVLVCCCCAYVVYPGCRAIYRTSYHWFGCTYIGFG